MQGDAAYTVFFAFGIFWIVMAIGVLIAVVTYSRR